MMRLDGKHILLIAPQFFAYDEDIRDEMLRRGATVDFLPDRPFNTPLMVALTKMQHRIILPFADKFYQRAFETYAKKHYDYILVVNGQTLSAHILRELRSNYPQAKMILYLWDALENRPHLKNHFAVYDSAWSFDHKNATQYAIKHRPLFFSPGFEQAPATHYDYHLSFIGTVHTDRYSVISQLRQQLPASLQNYWYLYLQAPWVLSLYKCTKPSMRQAKKSEFHFKPLNKKSVQTVFSQSLSILDIQHPKQHGLTMRAFEAMAAHKKLVTTNAEIKDYDFYRPENILIIARNDPRVPSEFLQTPHIPLPQAVYRKYSIEGWLDEVLTE